VLASLGEESEPEVESLEDTKPVRAHTASFFTTPAREERRAPEVHEQLATFQLDREEYGLDVRLVETIIRAGEVTPVPRAPAFVEGVINLRGRVVPVIDLKKKLGLGEVERTKRARVVVVRVRESLIGLLVDAALQVLKVPISRIEPAPEAVGREADYIRGVAKLDAGLIILVDLEKVLAAELGEAGAR
jgi:purine-binding chemotaxis protein CheW